MKIAFRVDGNKKLGMGHINRCKIISKNLEKNNVTCIFITQFRQIYEHLQSEGFVVFLIKNKNESKQVNHILKKEYCSKLVIDSKRKSVGELIKKLDKQFKIILIDNLHHSNYADLVIIPSVENPKKRYSQNSIVGTPYVLHGVEKPFKSIRQKNNSILVSMGGSDKYNITQKIISSFRNNNNDFDLIVALGKFYDKEKQILKIINNDNRFHIVKNSSLVTLMQQSIVGVFAFGITVYEAAVCSLPSFVLSHSDENDYSAKLVAQYGWISYVGKHNEINYDDVVKNILDLMNNKKELQKMKKACLQIDGLGPLRVAEHIQKL